MGQGCGGAHLGEGQSPSQTSLVSQHSFFFLDVNVPKKMSPFLSCADARPGRLAGVSGGYFGKIDVVVPLVLIPVRAAERKPLPLLASLLQEHVFWVVSLNTLFILVFGESAKPGHAAITLKSEQRILHKSGLSSEEDI